jgi:SAM-dependent methyltransferase
MEIKFRNFGVAIALGGIAAGLLGFIIFLIVTSWIWIPLALIFSPFIIAAYFILRKTPLGAIVHDQYLKAYDFLFYGSEGVRRFLWQGFYDFICWLYPQVQWKVMNYGYAPFSEQGKLINNLSAEFEEERFPLQLYHYVATSFKENENLKGKNVLEVGSGRGGGLNYISTSLKPQKCIGVDLSLNQVEFCRRAYASNPNIEFFEGDSERLAENPNLRDKQFDLVVNVESSHCYGNFRNFIKGVDKLLKTGGTFAFTDFRSSGDIEQLEQDLESFGLKIVKKEDITVNVLHALKLDETRRVALINGFVHKWLRPVFKKFSGLSGSRINEAMEARETIYMAYILKKTA